MIYELRMRYQLKKRVKKVVFMSTWRKKLGVSVGEGKLGSLTL